MGRAQTLGPPRTLLPVSHTWVSLTQGGPGLGGGGGGTRFCGTEKAPWASILGMNPQRWTNNARVPSSQFPHMPGCLFEKNPGDPAGGSRTHSPNLNQPLVLQQQLNDSSVIISALKTYLVSG